MSLKGNLIEQFLFLSENYEKIILLDHNGIGAAQFQQLRNALGDKGIILNGKKKILKKAIELNRTKYPKLEKLISSLNHEICLLFTNEKNQIISRIIQENHTTKGLVPGEIVQEEIIIYPQRTKLFKDKSQIFEQLGIPYRIMFSYQLEILSETKIKECGKRVTPLEAEFMKLIDLKLHKCIFKVIAIFENGEIYPPELIDFTDECMDELLKESIVNIACISLGANYTTTASCQSEIINCLNNVLAVSIEQKFVIEETKLLHEYLKDPEKYKRTHRSAIPLQKVKKYDHLDSEEDDLNIHPFDWEYEY